MDREGEQETMKNNQTFFVGQKAFIQNGDELLLLINPRYKLDLPGGRIQEGETDLKKSFEREIEEETGLTIEIGKPFHTWIWELDMKRGPVFLVAHSCNYVSGEFRISKEHSDFMWVNKNTYKPVVKKYKEENPEICEAIEKYFSKQ